MQLKTQEVLNAYGALQRLGKLQFTSVVAYRVAKLTRVLKPTAEAFEETQQALLKQVGTEDPDRPGAYNIKDRERWAKEMAQLIAEPVDIETFLTFKPSDFGDVKIEPEIFVGLDPFLVEDAAAP